MRSQNFTYAMEIRKKAIVAAPKIMSRISVFLHSDPAIEAFGGGTRITSGSEHHAGLMTRGASVAVRGRCQGSRDSEDSQRQIVLPWFARCLGRIGFLDTNRFVDPRFLAFADQRDQETGHKADSQNDRR